MLIARISLITATTLSLLIALASYRFLALGLPLSFPDMLGQIKGQRLAFILHISFAPVALAIGALQFFAGIRQRKPLHCWLGRSYGLAVLISGISGIFAALNAAGGLSTQLGFTLLALVTANAIRHAMTRRISQHHRKLLVTVARSPHSLLHVDMRFRPFIDLKEVSLWKLQTSFSPEYRAVQMASDAGLLN